MAKLVLEIEIDKPLQNNDVIRFNHEKNKWQVVSYKTFNNELYKERNKLINLINETNQRIDKCNEKIKLHKDVLKILTGRDL